MHIRIDGTKMKGFLVSYEKVGAVEMDLSLRALHGALSCDRLLAKKGWLGNQQFVVLAPHTVDDSAFPSILGLGLRGPALIFSCTDDALCNIGPWEETLLRGALELTNWRFSDGRTSEVLVVRMGTEPWHMPREE